MSKRAENLAEVWEWESGAHLVKWGPEAELETYFAEFVIANGTPMPRSAPFQLRLKGAVWEAIESRWRIWRTYQTLELKLRRLP
jgi:hypothetical protein